MLPSIAGSSDAKATKGAQATGAEWLHGLMKEKGEGVLGQTLRAANLSSLSFSFAALTES